MGPAERAVLLLLHPRLPPSGEDCKFWLCQAQKEKPCHSPAGSPMKTLLACVVFGCFNLDLKGRLAKAWNLKVKASGLCLCSLDICLFWLVCYMPYNKDVAPFLLM